MKLNNVTSGLESNMWEIPGVLVRKYLIVTGIAVILIKSPEVTMCHGTEKVQFVPFWPHIFILGVLEILFWGIDVKCDLFQNKRHTQTSTFYFVKKQRICKKICVIWPIFCIKF